MSSSSTHERSAPKPIPLPSEETSGSSQYGPMAQSASPPMSPSAFSTPLAASPTSESRNSRHFSIPFPFQGRSMARAVTADGIFRSRSKSPRKAPPTALDTERAEPTTASNVATMTTPILATSAQSASNLPDGPVRAVSDPATSPISPSHPISPGRPPLGGKSKKTSGTTSHCGRHSNEWLFGGFSVRDTVQGIWKDGDGNDR